MEVKQEIKLNKGQVEILIKKEHQFSDLEKKILNKLALNGYYQIRGSWEEHQEKHDALDNLIQLGLVTEDLDAWHYTVDVVKSDEVGSFFLQIIKEGV